MGMSAIASLRGFPEAGKGLEASTCAICAQPIRRTAAAWEHESTGVSARLPVHHHATPVPGSPTVSAAASR
jgi:hypothetical protein